MKLLKKAYNGNHTLTLDFKVPAASTQTLTSGQFMIGGILICQFRVDVNFNRNNYNSVTDVKLTISEMFDMIDKSVDNCYPIIRSICFGVNSITKDGTDEEMPCLISDDIIGLPKLKSITLWHYKGMVRATEVKEEYDVNFTIKIKGVSFGPSPFKVLYEDTELTDFELCGGNGSIDVHKAVLAASSPVLNSMLSGKWNETSKGKVELASITEETLNDLKTFMYLKKLPGKDKPAYTRLEELMKLACYLMMSDLIQACTTQLLLDLTEENAYRLLSLGFMYKSKGLIKGILLSSENKSINLIEIVDNYQLDP